MEAVRCRDQPDRSREGQGRPQGRREVDHELSGQGAGQNDCGQTHGSVLNITMDQPHVLDGDPPEDDFIPGILAASHYFENSNFLGLVECFALLSWQVTRSAYTSRLDKGEVLALRAVEAFHLDELNSMQRILRSGEQGEFAFGFKSATIKACCRASEYSQRAALAELIHGVTPEKGWALGREWIQLKHSPRLTFQAACIFTAWIHQRFELLYLSGRMNPEDPPSSFDAAAVRPYTLRTLSTPSGPWIRRSRLAGWACDHLTGEGVCASLLAVPCLRDPREMVEALRDASRTRTGPFFRLPPAKRGVVVTELDFEIRPDTESSD